MPPLLPQSAPRHEAEAQNPNLINIGTPCAASPRGSVAIISHKDAENAPHSTLARFGPVFSLILGLVSRFFRNDLRFHSGLRSVVHHGVGVLHAHPIGAGLRLQ
jgi:hypothetical protein